MKKRYIGYAVWLISACLLYFFENNTGTRIVLACTLWCPRSGAACPNRTRTEGRPESSSEPPEILQKGRRMTLAAYGCICQAIP